MATRPCHKMCPGGFVRHVSKLPKLLHISSKLVKTWGNFHDLWRRRRRVHYKA